MNMNIDMSEYKDLFISEVREYLGKLNELILTLEKEKDNDEIVNEIFRLVHSIKGSSAAMGLTDLSNLAHAMEDLITALKEKKLEISSDIIDLLLKGIDFIEKMIDAYEKEQPLPSPKKFIEILRKITEKSEREINIAEQAGAQNETIFKLVIRLSEECPSPKLKVFAILKEVEERGVLINVNPDPASMDKDVREIVIFFIARKDVIPELETVLSKIPEISEFNIQETSAEETGLDVRKLEELKLMKPSDEEVTRLVKKIEEFIESEESVTIESGVEKDYMHKRIEEIKVKVKSLDKLFDLVGEIILIKSRLAQIAKKLDSSELYDVISSFELIANMLQEEVMNMRLVPVGQVFNLLPRLVRDLARELGKEVDLIIEGKDIALDRKILEEIVDPLMHVVRNAVDHGIEKPEERTAKGKPRVGTIIVSARREGDYVVIEVEDDGRGIDPEYVKKIAVERGLISRSVAEKLSDKEALMLITLPGFTTRNQSTQVSGRGIGMNIVKEKIESIGGVLEIDSKPGVGTKVIMKLPPSLAIIYAIIVRVGNEKFAVPITSIERIIDLDDNIIRSVAGKEVVYIHNKEILPLYRLSKILNINDASEKQALIVRTDKGRYALAVDYVEELESVVVKPLGKIVKNVRGIAGATILGDGRVCLILDPYTLVSLYEYSEE